MTTDLSAVHKMLATGQSLRILGIDPGSRQCGYAFVTSRTPHLINRRCIQLDDVGVIKANLELDFCQRVALIHTALHRLVCEWKPHICVIEDAFFGLNARSALKLGQARGALMTAVTREGISVVEVTPTHVKKCIGGRGSADKEQVSQSLKALIGFERGELPHDVSDALAIALSFGLTIPMISATTNLAGLETNL